MQSNSPKIRLGATAAVALLVGGPSIAPAQTTAALIFSGYRDSAHGSSYDVDAWIAPSDHWSIGGGVGHSDSDLSGVEFSGQSLRLNTDVTFSGFTAGVAAQRWRDSDQLTSNSTEGQLSWTALNGFGLAAIIGDRRLKVNYQVRPLAGQSVARQVDLSGTGYGGELGYYGERWHAAVRGVSYSYGPTLARVRAAANSATTTQFPRLAALVDSLLTRGVSAPEHEISLTLGRSLTRSSLQANWILQRDAVAQTDSMSLSLRHGYRFTPHVELATTLGMSDGDAFDNTAFGGLALTLRR